MTLTLDDKEWIAECFKSRGECACGIGHSDQKEMGHLVGMIRDSGGGDLSKGIESLRDIFKIVGRWKGRIDKVGGAMLIATGTILFAAIWKSAAVIWEAVRKVP